VTPLEKQLKLHIKHQERAKETYWNLQKKIFDILPQKVRDSMTHECWVSINHRIPCATSPIGCCVFDNKRDERQDFCLYCGFVENFYTDFEVVE
jgi:hypothetical protein